MSLYRLGPLLVLLLLPLCQELEIVLPDKRVPRLVCPFEILPPTTSSIS